MRVRHKSSSSKHEVFLFTRLCAVWRLGHRAHRNFAIEAMLWCGVNIYNGFCRVTTSKVTTGRGEMRVIVFFESHKLRAVFSRMLAR